MTLPSPQPVGGPQAGLPKAKKPGPSLRERIEEERLAGQARRRRLLRRIPRVLATLALLVAAAYLIRVPVYRQLAASDGVLGNWAVENLVELRDPESFALFVQHLGRDRDHTAFNELVFCGAGRTRILASGEPPAADEPLQVAAHRQVLLSALTSGEEDLRRGALYALWTLEDRPWTHDEALLTPVGALLDPPCEDVVARRYAALVLSAGCAPAGLHDAIARAALEDEDRLVRHSALRAAARTGARALGERLRPALSSPFPEVRREASLALAALGVDVSLETLLAIYRTDDEIYRADVLEVIATRDEPRVLDLLLEALDSNVGATRRAAVDGLATRPGEAARHGLERALGDSNDVVRLAAIDALAAREDGGESVAPLVRALRHHGGWQEISRLHGALAKHTSNVVPAPTPLAESWPPVIEAWELYAGVKPAVEAQR